jgi:hypothetical protein
MLSREQLAAIGVMTTASRSLSACLLLTQCGRHTTCVIAAGVAQVADGVELAEARVVRFVDHGWSVRPGSALLVVRDGAEFGVCDSERRWWVPNHSQVPFRALELSPAEHARLLGHIATPRPWDLFKYVQLTYLSEPGFTGGRDALAGPAGYGAVVRDDRWYVTLDERG